MLKHVKIITIPLIVSAALDFEGITVRAITNAFIAKKNTEMQIINTLAQFLPRNKNITEVIERIEIIKIVAETIVK